MGLDFSLGRRELRCFAEELSLQQRYLQPHQIGYLVNKDLFSFSTKPRIILARGGRWPDPRLLSYNLAPKYVPRLHVFFSSYYSNQKGTPSCEVYQFSAIAVYICI